MSYLGACGATNCWRCLFGALDDMEDRMACECGEMIRELTAERDALLRAIQEAHGLLCGCLGDGPPRNPELASACRWPRLRAAFAVGGAAE